MNPLRKVKRNDPQSQLGRTHEQIKEFCFFLEYYTYQRHAEQLRLEGVYLPVLMVFPQETVGPHEVPGSWTDLHLA